MENAKCADYIRSRRPDMRLLVNLSGHYPIYAEDDFQALVSMSSHVDYIVDNTGSIVHGEYRERAFKELQCAFGASGGCWFYIPQQWDKLRWFLPYAKMSCAYLKEFYTKGGRATEYYMGPVINPGSEYSILCAGKILNDTSRDIEDVAYEAVGELYGPDSPETQRELAGIFLDADDAYFNNLRQSPYIQGEMQLTFPFNGPKDSPPIYLEYNVRLYWPTFMQVFLMNANGRERYKITLQQILERIPGLAPRVREKEKIDRIRVCIENVIKDIDNYK